MSTIHPTAVITGDVQLGSGNTIGAFAVITGPVVLGNDNWIGTGTVIGPPPEVRSWLHPTAEASSSGNGIRIGSRNIIREYVQIHQGWNGETTVGDDTFIMNQAYIAHDCRIGDNATLASSVLVAGHVRVGAGANLGLGTAVHQFRTIGRGAMIGMSSAVTRDIPAFAKAYGNPAVVRGVNAIGMERSGQDARLIALLASAYAHEDVDLDEIVEDELRTQVQQWRDRAESD
jgi:UDP-N-acetylglucosamine acyltransferase